MTPTSRRAAIVTLSLALIASYATDSRPSSHLELALECASLAYVLVGWRRSKHEPQP